MDDKWTVLPLKDAYRFGAEHGLAREVAEVREMEIEWDLSYTSSVRRGFIIDLFTKKQLFETFKGLCWPAGDTPRGQRKTAFWLRLKGRYADFLAGGSALVEEAKGETEAADQEFAAETDLRDFLAANLSSLEPGLSLYQHGSRSGVEFPVDNGRIDILAVDTAGRFMVLELKLSHGRNKALGQLLYYMGWVDKHLGGAPCRGAVVAREISDELISRRSVLREYCSIATSSAFQ